MGLEPCLSLLPGRWLSCSPCTTSKHPRIPITKTNIPFMETLDHAGLFHPSIHSFLTAPYVTTRGSPPSTL